MANATSVTFPDVFEVIKVNGEDYSSNFFATETILVLAPGEHTILMAYENIFDDLANDDHTKVRSEPFLLSLTVSTEPLKLVTPKLANDKLAKEYIKNPQLIIIDNNEQTQPYKLIFLKDVANKMLAMQTSSVVTLDTNISSTHKEVKIKANEPNNKALEMLKYWWQQATPEEQQSFKKMITESSN